MIRVDIEETIDRPVEEVFERLVDIDRYPEWMPDESLLVTCRQDSDGPVGEGTTYVDETRLGTLHGEVAAFDRPHEVVFHYTSRLLGATVMEGWPGYTLKPDGEGGTRVHHAAEARLRGPFKLFEPLVQRMAEKERGRTVDALKESFEGSPPGESPR